MQTRMIKGAISLDSIYFGASWDNLSGCLLLAAADCWTYYIKGYLAGTQWPLTHIYPAGQSEWIEHAKSGSARFKRPGRCLLWCSATPAPAQISKGARSPASNANIQLRKLLIFPPRSPCFSSINLEGGHRGKYWKYPPERHTVLPHIVKKAIDKVT